MAELQLWDMQRTAPGEINALTQGLCFHYRTGRSRKIAYPSVHRSQPFAQFDRMPFQAPPTSRPSLLLSYTHRPLFTRDSGNNWTGSEFIIPINKFCMRFSFGGGPTTKIKRRNGGPPVRLGQNRTTTSNEGGGRPEHLASIREGTLSLRRCHACASHSYRPDRARPCCAAAPGEVRSQPLPRRATSDLTSHDILPPGPPEQVATE